MSYVLFSLYQYHLSMLKIVHNIIQTHFIIYFFSLTIGTNGTTGGGGSITLKKSEMLLK